MSLKFVLLLALVVSGAAGCSASSRLPQGASLLPAPNLRSGDVANEAKTFGTGLSTEAKFYAYSTDYDFTHCWAKSQASERGCPPIDFGQRLTRYHWTRSFSFPYGVDAKLTQSGSVSLGRETLAVTNMANSFSVGVEGNAVASSWSDVLHVESKSLAPGTRVTISVSLALTNAGGDIDCIYSHGSQPYEGFGGPGKDAAGNGVAVIGRCIIDYDEWVFTLGAPYGPQGTTDTGTIETEVGATVPLSGGGEVFTTLDLGGDGTGHGTLLGTATWTITGITKGASYYTDSGRTYR